MRKGEGEGEGKGEGEGGSVWRCMRIRSVKGKICLDGGGKGRIFFKRNKDEEECRIES